MTYFEYMGWFGDAEMIENGEKMVRTIFENFVFRHFSSKNLYFHLKSFKIIRKSYMLIGFS